MANLTAPFKVAGCSALAMKQRLALRLTGKSQVTDGKHPGSSATLTDSGGGANLRKAVTKLPLSLALDPDNAQELCKPEQRLARACPAKSIVGRARADVGAARRADRARLLRRGHPREARPGASIRTLPEPLDSA